MRAWNCSAICAADSQLEQRLPLNQKPSSGAYSALCVALAVLFAVPVWNPATSARAQERVLRSPSILEFFGFRRAKPPKPPVKTVKRVKRVNKSANRSVNRNVLVKTQRRKTPSVRQIVKRTVRGNSATAPVQGLRFDPVEEPAAPVAKLENAKTVLVVGDFMAGAVAEGLIEAFDVSANVKIAEKWNGSSGFVRSDYYDWPISLPAIIAEIKPSAIIVMLGTNDRQQLQAGNEKLTLGTPAWSQEYEKRVRAMAEAIKAGGAPAIWVGQPALRSSQMTTSMLAFNDIYRRNIEAVGGTFVDIWDGFVDENGVFQPTGPDMNGLPARLRGSDGISFSKAGKRKAAFYVEKPLRQLLNETGSPSIAILPKGGAAGFIGPLLPAPVVIVRTDPMSLNDPAMDGGTELLGATPTPARAAAAKSPRDLLVEDGIAAPAKPGRVDDFTARAPSKAGLDEAVPLTDQDVGQTAATK
jgi:uncharacterized protein